MSSTSTQMRVGALILAALVILAVGVFFIVEQNNLFARKNHYFIEFPSVNGLNEGNPVQLNGVRVGSVDRIVLPEDASKELLEVHISVDRRYEQRIREDSQARIRTLGLLGDKYVQITSGSPGTAIIAPGGQIPAAETTDVDKLMASGEDAVNNVVAISHSLAEILERIQQGKGLLGELTSNPEQGRRIVDSLFATLDSMQNFARSVETGQGPMARLINDKELGDRLAASVTHLEGILDQVEHGQGPLSLLLNDPESRDDLDQTLIHLRELSSDLEVFSEKLRSGEGLLPRLTSDPKLADEVTRDLQRLLENLGDVAEKLNDGQGTAGALINDPSIYQAFQDIVVGVNESKLLRWLIRNRQKKGIEKRYDEEQQSLEEEGEAGGSTSR
jgi:phospholipid/cholesterol/gamma-HCH transport system substrate-binding protein